MDTRESLTFNKSCLVGNEIEYATRALKSGRLSSDGKLCRQCEEVLSNRLGGAGVLMTNSGTAALELSAILLDLGPGDEVITPSFTFVSTANAICRTGASPKFVDVRAETMNMDERLVEDAITERTRAILPVHYAGVGCAPLELNAIAKRHGLAVIEDASHCIGANFDDKPLGTFGLLAALSFQEQKNLSCGEGGAIVVNDPSLLERAHIVRDKGTNRRAFFMGQAEFYSWVDVGSSFGLPEISAAVLLAQLEQIEAVQAKRTRLYQAYRDGLAPLAANGIIELPSVPDGADHNAHVTFFFAENRAVRDALLKHLVESGVTALFHYLPLHNSPYGVTLGYKTGDLPVTEDRAGRLVRLPMYYEMPVSQVEKVIDAISSFFRGKSQTSTAEKAHGSN